jgi:ABC-2 type transport system ATP-binding protein
MSEAPPVEVRGLVKRYGALTAVDHVELTVEVGDVYGYLGPNGAGKTTSLRMMLGLIRPTEGTVRLFGRDPLESVRALDGVAGFVEAPTFYPYLTARRNLELLAAYDGNGAGSRVDEALETVELAGRARDRVGGYSHGMKQRLGIAAALLREPKLLMLDEPATGLDPAGMRDMRLLIRRLADQGITVVLSSHLLAEVEELCNKVAIVRTGRIVYEGAIAELKRSAGTTYRLQTTDDERALAVCRAQRGIHEVRVQQLDHVAAAHTGEAGSRARGKSTRITFAADERAVAELSQALVESGALIKMLSPQTVTLEDLFFSLTEGVDGEAIPAAAEAVAAS